MRSLKEMIGYTLFTGFMATSTWMAAMILAATRWGYFLTYIYSTLGILTAVFAIITVFAQNTPKEAVSAPSTEGTA
jgi:hypothetical protein